MFASGKAADTGLPPILLGGENSITLVNPSTTPYTLTFDSSNSDNIGIGDLIIVSAIGSDTGLSATTSDFTSLHTSSTDFGATILYAVFDGTSISVSFSPLYSNRQNYIIQYAWFKNVDTSNPIDTSFSLQTAAGQNQTIDPAALTTVTKNAVVVSGVIFFDGNQAISGTLPQDALSTPSNLTAIDEVTTAWEPFSGATLDNVLHSRMTYATVPTAGSFDPASYGTPVADSSIRYKYWTLALKPANPEQTLTQVTALNGGKSVYVYSSDYTLSSGRVHRITVDSSTTYSNGKTVGLGDIVVVALSRNPFETFYNEPTVSGFTKIYSGNNAGNNRYAYIYYGIYNGTDITIDVEKFSVATDQPFIYHMYSVRYPDTSTPFDVSLDVDEYEIISTIAGTYTINHAALTTITDNAVIINGLIGGGSGNDSPATNPPSLGTYLSLPSNMSEACAELQVAGYTGSFNDPKNHYTFVAQHKKETAGSFDPGTWGTLTLAANQDVMLRSYTLAIKPA